MSDLCARPAVSTSAKPIRVALLTDSDVFAGTERHMLDLALGLRELGAAPTLSAPQRAQIAVRGALEALPMLPIEKGGLFDPRAIQILHRALRRGQFDVLHAHNGRTHLSAALAVMLARRGACVFTQHFIEPGHTRGGGARKAAFERVHHLTNARSHRFIAISGAVSAAMTARGDAPTHRIVVVPNGIGDLGETSLKLCPTTRERYGVAADAPLLLCVARLATEKDHATLLEAFAGVRRAFPNARLWLAGDGALKNEMKRQIEALHLSEAVQMLGFVAEVPVLIAAADALVLPAPREPFGLVFLEAMALQKPVVACRGGAAPEIIVEGETGLLFSPHSPSELQQALEHLMHYPSQAKQMGKAGRERFLSHFTRDLMAQRTLDVYRQAMSATRFAVGGAA